MCYGKILRATLIFMPDIDKNVTAAKNNYTP